MNKKYEQVIVKIPKNNKLKGFRAKKNKNNQEEEEEEYKIKEEENQRANKIKKADGNIKQNEDYLEKSKLRKGTRNLQDNEKTKMIGQYEFNILLEKKKEKEEEKNSNARKAL